MLHTIVANNACATQVILLGEGGTIFVPRSPGVPLPIDGKGRVIRTLESGYRLEAISREEEMAASLAGVSAPWLYAKLVAEQPLALSVADLQGTPVNPEAASSRGWATGGVRHLRTQRPGVPRLWGEVKVARELPKGELWREFLMRQELEKNAARQRDRTSVTVDDFIVYADEYIIRDFFVEEGPNPRDFGRGFIVPTSLLEGVVRTAGERFANRGGRHRRDNVRPNGTTHEAAPELGKPVEGKPGPAGQAAWGAPAHVDPASASQPMGVNVGEAVARAQVRTLGLRKPEGEGQVKTNQPEARKTPTAPRATRSLAEMKAAISGPTLPAPKGDNGDDAIDV